MSTENNLSNFFKNTFQSHKTKFEDLTLKLDSFKKIWGECIDIREKILGDERPSPLSMTFYKNAFKDLLSSSKEKEKQGKELEKEERERLQQELQKRINQLQDILIQENNNMFISNISAWYDEFESQLRSDEQYGSFRSEITKQLREVLNTITSSQNKKNASSLLPQQLHIQQLRLCQQPEQQSEQQPSFAGGLRRR